MMASSTVVNVAGASSQRTLAAGGGAADLDRLVGLRPAHQQRVETFLDALFDVRRVGGEHVRDLDALALHEDLLRASLGARACGCAVAADRLRQAADAAREDADA